MRVPETIEAEKKLKKELKKVWESLRPPPRMSLSEWCDAHRLLAREYHPVGGRWTTIPYQREILDTIGDFHTQEIVLCTSAQVGKTSMLENLIAWHVVFDPAPILTVFPETSTLRAFSQDRIDTMVRDMPELNDKFDPKRERDKSNTITYKKFRGGHLTFATAGSARQMRSRPIRILLCDEVDAYDLNVSGEGDPIRLAKVRTANFFNRKIVITSTPTTEETSRVWKAFLESDQRYYYVPCPHCGEMQILTFSEISQHYEEKKTGKIMFEGNAPESTYYECVKGCKIEHYEKHKMLEGGEWRKHNPGHKVAGFFVNSLYSPWIEWKDLVSEFLEVKHDAFQLQVFVNTKLGEIWKKNALPLTCTIWYRTAVHTMQKFQLVLGLLFAA
jgi:phage terminase large subunit GpA-like protein